MDLFRDCLDQQIVDRKKRRMGRADGIVLELDPNRAPRVAYIEIGGVTLTNRVSRGLHDLVLKIMRRFGIRTDRYRLAWREIHVGVNEIQADVDAEKTLALEFELWLRKHVIGRIPGA